MNTHTSPKPVVTAGSYAIFEDGNKILFVNYGTDKFTIFNFVAGLLFVIFGVNGALQISANQNAATILLILSGVCLLGLFAGVKAYKKAKNKAFKALTLTGVIDLGSGNLLNGENKVLAPLSKVEFGKALQVTSSSPSIVAKWPNGGRLVLLRGNPFTGGSSQFLSYLKAKELF
jgi:hypothetical protein